MKGHPEKVTLRCHLKNDCDAVFLKTGKNVIQPEENYKTKTVKQDTTCSVSETKNRVFAEKEKPLMCLKQSVKRYDLHFKMVTDYFVENENELGCGSTGSG